MNTERPEWNDANNALVGYGLSMVTAGHLLRYVRFCRDWWSFRPQKQLSLSAPVADLSIFTHYFSNSDTTRIKRCYACAGCCELGLSG